MSNPIYKLIELFLEQIQKELGLQIELRENSEGVCYYKVNISVEANKKLINLNSAEYSISNLHVTIFENLSKKEGFGETSHHASFNLTDTKNAADQLVSHVYFNRFNQFLGAIVKDANDQVKQCDAKSMAQMMRLHITKFTDYLWRIYQGFYQKHAASYESSLTKLTLQSKRLDVSNDAEVNREEWQAYNNILIALSATLDSWKRCLLFTLNLPPFEYFEKLKITIAERLQQLSPQAELAKLEREQRVRDATKKLEIELEQLKDSDVTKHEKLLNELELIEAYLNSFVAESSAYVERVLEIKKTLTYLLFELIIAKNDAKDFSETTLKNWIKNVEVNLKVCRLVVMNGCARVLKYIFEQHPYLNPNEIIDGQDDLLLKIAYEKKQWECFEILLEVGANCDAYISKGGNTLLIQACLDQQSRPMRALRLAGASTFSVENSGYTALGVLTMIKASYNIALIQQFLETGPGVMIDYMQGSANFKSTPLSFACQENRLDLILLLLQHGADANFCRTTDTLSCLEICVLKRYRQALETILNNSQCSLEASIGSAITAAKKHGLVHISQLLTEHAQKNGYAISSNRVITFSPGAPLLSLENFLPKKFGL